MANKMGVQRLQALSGELLLKQICCITDDIALTAAADELSYLKGVGARYVHPKNKYELIRELSDKGGNLLHVACRDRVDARPAKEWAIQLPDGGAFKPDDLNQRGVSGQIRKKCPLVFFNIYHSKSKSSPLLGMEDWARRFIDHGCGAIIGCVWEVGSPLASEFVIHFYKSLIGGLTLGQSIRSAREEILKKENSFWLAYYLYGNQNFRFKSI